MYYSNPRLIKAKHSQPYDKEVRDAMCRNCGCIIGEQLRYPHLTDDFHFNDNKFRFKNDKDNYEYCPYCGHKFVKELVLWCIITEDEFGTMYLGWQNPVWDDGYFWTSKDVIEEIISDNIPAHPFLFKTKQEAINHATKLKLPQEWKVIQF